MVRDYVKNELEKAQAGAGQIEMFIEEYEYAKKHQLISTEKMDIVLKKPEDRFMDAYIERVDKENEQVISEERPSEFLKMPIRHLEKNMGEFIYLESEAFEQIRIEAVSFEKDDVFRTYEVLAGVKLQKKKSEAIKNFLDTGLNGGRYSLLFNQEDGLFDLNFSLEGAEGLSEELSFGEAFSLMYSLFFSLMEAVEAGN